MELKDNYLLVKRHRSVQFFLKSKYIIIRNMHNLHCNFINSVLDGQIKVFVALLHWNELNMSHWRLLV